MTGLDPNKDIILEIACIVTDKELKQFGHKTFIISTPKQVLDTMDEWCIEHHGASGLTQACLESTTTLEEAENQVLSYIQSLVREKKGLLAGNSIYLDKVFLTKYMPKIIDYLDYRIVDVSSIKELTKRWYPLVFAETPKKKLGHRALDDIKESIAELEYYRKTVFIPV